MSEAGVDPPRVMEFYASPKWRRRDSLQAPDSQGLTSVLWHPTSEFRMIVGVNLGELCCPSNPFPVIF